MQTTPRIRETIRELAQHPSGCHSSNPALAEWTTMQVCQQGRAMVATGQLYSAKVSHRCVRYFSTAATRDAFIAALRVRPVKWRKGQLMKVVETKAPWPADAEPVLTERTIFTACPSHAPRFQERTFSFVHQGLRCA